MVSEKQQYAKAKLLEFIQMIKDGEFDDELKSAPTSGCDGCVYTIDIPQFNCSRDDNASDRCSRDPRPMIDKYKPKPKDAAQQAGEIWDMYKQVLKDNK